MRPSAHSGGDFYGSYWLSARHDPHGVYVPCRGSIPASKRLCWRPYEPVVTPCRQKRGLPVCRHGRPGRADPSSTLPDAARPIATASPPAAACHPPPRPATPRRGLPPPAAVRPQPRTRRRRLLTVSAAPPTPRRRLACFPLVAPASQLALAAAAARGRPAASAPRRRHRALARARGRFVSGNGATPVCTPRLSAMGALGPSRRRAVPVPLIGGDACGRRFARAGCPRPRRGRPPTP